MQALPFWIRESTEGVSHPLVKIIARPFYSIPFASRIRPIQSVRDVDIEEESKIRHKTGGGEPVGGTDFALWKSAPDDLIRICRQEKPIDQYDIKFLQGWNDLPRDQLGARCHEQQRFGRRGELLILVKHNVPNGISDRRAAWLAHSDARNSSLRQTLGQKPDLSRLPRAFGSLEDDQLPAGHAQERVMIGLAAPFFMPSMIH
jgi:hypothetical protein